ncbi:TPA: trypsin-like serine peptidase [Staphylococcus aureus]|uniref:Serine protease n=2 Tax=Staphylococcus aureus TaxID=1280 RepID=A0A1W5T8R9_STAAU|nr:trypsin-like serine protease SP608A [Staphylococcus aureus]HDH5694723.1 trypsin-like serine protease [Staphylococcus aureus]HDH5697454.1 trypsin-like serine protease [Staphylococcus aureus]HDP6026687.1 trypsin-like serine protease [Staphylococcus aureus]
MRRGIMKFKKLIVLATIGLFISSFNISYAEDLGTRKLVDTTKDPKSKYAARYDPDYSLHCSATMITDKIGLTAKHCAGNKKINGYIGAVYPGHSGLSTPFGMMNISEYIPNDANDIAIIKGEEKDMDNTYKHYMKNTNINITPFSTDELKKLKGKEVYSYGYPGINLTGYKQYKSEGVITSYNPITGDISTTLPSEPGQSGSGVFLKDGDRFLGVLHSHYNDNNGNHLGRVTPMNVRLTNWFNANK